MIRLNTLKPAPGSKVARKRVGRGTGSGLGKTCGRGHKGQKSRSGGKPNIGFEGGQMPLQRRLPKRGFRSLTRRRRVEIRLGELATINVEVIDFAALRQARLVNNAAQRAKVILSGSLDRPVTLRGIEVTRGARAAIENAGGKVED